MLVGIASLACLYFVIIMDKTNLCFLYFLVGSILALLWADLSPTLWASDHGFYHQSTQDTLHTPERVDIVADEAALYQVHDAFMHNGQVTVVQDPEPGVLQFQAGEMTASWGREGEGPSDLQSPAGVVVNDTYIAVLDRMPAKVVYFDHEGNSIHNTMIDGYQFASGWAVTEEDTLISVSNMSDESGTSDLVRLHDGETLEALSVDAGEDIRVEPDEGFPMTMPAPFMSPAWTITHEGRVYQWTHDGYIVETDTRGNEQRRYSTDDFRAFPINDDDIDGYLEHVFDPEAEFQGVRDAFRHVREEARESVDFPDVFPAVLDMKAAPSGGLWLRRTTTNEGSIWSYWHDGEEQASYQFSAEQRVLHFLDDERVLVRGRDDDGAPIIEVYSVPVAE